MTKPSSRAVVPVTAQFSGDGDLCTALAPVPEYVPGHCPIAVAYQPPDWLGFSGVGGLSAEIQSGTGPITSLVSFPVSGDFWSADDPALTSSVSNPDIEPVQGLVTFTPRLPQGFQAFLNNYVVSQDTNNIQTVNLIGAITGGSWGLNFNGVWTNPYIVAGPTAADVQAALEALSTIGAGNVTVTDNLPNPGYPSFTVELVGALANAPQNQMLSDASLLDVSSGSAGVSVVMLQAGSAARIGNATIAFPPRLGRIWTTGRLCSINRADSPDVDLLANMPEFDLEFDLIYDVTFSLVTYGDANRSLAPFAFTAPVDNTPVCLSDFYLERLPYQPPIGTAWFPGWTPESAQTPSGVITNPNVTPMTDWRQRRRAG